MQSLLKTLLLFIGCQVLNAQDQTSLWLTVADNGKTIQEALQMLAEQQDVDIILQEKKFGQMRIKGIRRQTSLQEFLDKKHSGYFVYAYYKKNFLILNPETAKQVQDKTCRVFPIRHWGATLRGNIMDEDSTEAIIGANIYFPKFKKGTVSDVSGDFEMAIQEEVLLTEISYAGYQKKNILLVQSSLSYVSELDVALSVTTDLLQTVTVVAQRKDANVSDQRTGIEKLKIEAIKQLPAFLGEVDPVRSITTLPGVSSTGDVAAGFNVRGGENSQNLILQDGAIIFNPTHLFGFFSSFNPDFISDVVLLKGGGPAQYGGRTSSVLDIHTRNGDLQKHSVSGGVGLISSRLSIEGPIVKNKASFLLGGRVSYSNWFLKSYNDPELKNSYANFYDLTAKFFQQINKKNYITATAYYGFDNFKLGTDSIFSWQTQNISLKWDHIFNAKAISSLSLASSNYKTKVFYDNPVFGFTNTNSVQVWTANYWYQQHIGKAVSLEAGINNNFSKINPGNSAPISASSNALPVSLNIQKTLESAVFLEASIDLGERWALTSGIRYSHFFRLGPDDIFLFDYDRIEGRTAPVRDILHYKNNKIITQYGGFEPRASLRYLIHKNISLKAGYNRTKQYLHQVSPTVSPSPLDFWIASSPNIQPQQSDQYSLGYFQNFKDNIIETSVEGFYKKMSNVIDYIDGVNLNLNPLLEAGLSQGQGHAYGVEVLLKKKQGKYSGWVSYTYSRSYRIFDSSQASQLINEGKQYPSAFDQPHQLSFILNTKLGKRTTLSTNFTYNSGRPITIPVSKYAYDDLLSVNNYSGRNEYRIPDYHRLDVSLTVKSKERKRSRFSSEFIFSIYNLYARKNAFAIFFDNFGRAYKTSILGAALPSVSYNFKIK